MVGNPDDHPPVEPLTRRNTAGQRYTRLAQVEAQIQRALELSSSALLVAAGNTDQSAADYLQEETLVYLIRASRRRGQEVLVNDLSGVLIERCASFIDRKLWGLGEEAADAYQEVILELFNQILDLNSDRGDFLQVRFWVGIERLVFSAFGRALKRSISQDETVPLDSLAGYDGPDDAEAPTVRPALVDPELSLEDKSLYREALRLLPEPIRTAFILRHYHGWPIEDQDPTILTISRYFGKTARTIRNWLAEAEEILARWRGEQQ